MSFAEEIYPYFFLHELHKKKQIELGYVGTPGIYAFLDADLEVLHLNYSDNLFETISPIKHKALKKIPNIHLIYVSKTKHAKEKYEESVEFWNPKFSDLDALTDYWWLLPEPLRS